MSFFYLINLLFNEAKTEIIGADNSNLTPDPSGLKFLRSIIQKIIFIHQLGPIFLKFPLRWQILPS